MIRYTSRIFGALLSIAGILVVGFIDYNTGTEIRVFPLYFIPLIIPAWYLGKIEAVFFSLLATVVWIAAMYFSARGYSHIYIWIVNFITQGSAFVIFTVLLSHLNEALKRERAVSRTDTLTGLFNNLSFYEHASILLELCQRHNRPITLAYIDLDNFKNANDTQGHLYGDNLLRKVAGVFKANFRSSDLVARMGGDEFAILLPETVAEDARKTLEKILTVLVQAPELKACSVTASIGAVSYFVAPSNIDQMIKFADELMYNVKKSGKNHIIIESV